MRLRSIAVGAVTAGLAVGLLAEPAQAETRTFHDQHGDVRHKADIHRVKVTYNKRGVHVRIKLRDIKKQSASAARYRGSAAVFFDVRPGRRGPEFKLVGPIAPAKSGYDWSLLRTKSNWRTRQREALCKSSIRTNMRRNVVNVRIAKPCLRNPDMLNLKTGNIIRNKRLKAPKRIRVAVSTGTKRGAVRDWAPRVKRFYPAVQRG